MATVAIPRPSRSIFTDSLEAIGKRLTFDRVTKYTKDGGADIYEVPRHLALELWKAEQRSTPVWGRRRSLWALPAGAFLFGLSYVAFFKGANLQNIPALALAVIPGLLGAALGAWRAPLPQGEIFLRQDGDTLEQIAIDKPILSDVITNPEDATQKYTVVYPAPSYTRNAEEMQDEKEAHTGPRREINKIQLGLQIIMVLALFGGLIFYVEAEHKGPQENAASQQQEQPAPNIVPVASALPSAGQPFTKAQAAALLSLGEAVLREKGFADDQLTIMRAVVFNNAPIPPKYEVK